MKEQDFRLAIQARDEALKETQRIQDQLARVENREKQKVYILSSLLVHYYEKNNNSHTIYFIHSFIHSFFFFFKNTKLMKFKYYFKPYLYLSSALELVGSLSQ